MILRVLLMVFCIGFSSAYTSTAFAAPQGISAKAAAEIVQKRYGGKVLKVNRQASNGSYKVKIVTDSGKVISKNVNGRTGSIEGGH